MVLDHKSCHLTDCLTLGETTETESILCAKKNANLDR